MINFEKKKLKEFNPNRPQASDHSHKMLIVGGSGSGKTNSFWYW